MFTPASGTFRTWQALVETMSGMEGKTDLPVERPDFTVLQPSGTRLQHFRCRQIQPLLGPAERLHPDQS